MSNNSLSLSWCKFNLCSQYDISLSLSIHCEQGGNIYKLPADDVLRSYGLSKSTEAADDTIIAGTLLGSIFVFAPISRYDFNIY